jgi:hypothetical protein
MGPDRFSEICQVFFDVDSLSWNLNTLIIRVIPIEACERSGQARRNPYARISIGSLAFTKLHRDPSALTGDRDDRVEVSEGALAA